MFIDTIAKLYEIAVSKLAATLEKVSTKAVEEANRIKTSAELLREEALKSDAKADELKVKAAQQMQRASKLKGLLKDDNNNGIPDIIEDTLKLN